MYDAWRRQWLWGLACDKARRQEAVWEGHTDAQGNVLEAPRCPLMPAPPDREPGRPTVHALFFQPGMNFIDTRILHAGDAAHCPPDPSHRSL